MSTNWRNEFPDFDPADMPDVPITWEDASWHNDTCPSFAATSELFVYIDYADPAARELPDGKRFNVLRVVDTTEPLLETDDWQAVLDFIAKGGN